jgi:hypothetical protein
MLNSKLVLNIWSLPSNFRPSARRSVNSLLTCKPTFQFQFSTPDHSRSLQNLSSLCTHFTTSDPDLSKPEFLCTYFSNPDPDHFKTWITFKPTFQLSIPITLKPEFPLSLLFNCRSQSIQNLNSLCTYFSKKKLDPPPAKIKLDKFNCIFHISSLLLSFSFNIFVYKDLQK